ncbi:asparagine synthase-related protein [Oceanobacillus halophilus]|uniref:asparagine synthase (glutamine-hydrolyzing) n=1 Tax=Oceanobacillus halophilus TaxID=930130 RepID=A0A495A5D0_9BACI|nr:asparagine synthase-related protein [Oceanobacillus halophilus]RKQ34303.1 hypothetical protein D8M06_07950 [Oceanobacillus halophilus]
MSDFLFSRQIIPKGKMTEHIQRIYTGDKPPVLEFHGEWGSVAVSQNLYRAFQPYETDKYLCIVIGGPVLYFCDNHFLKDGKNNNGTRHIYNRWQQGDINWKEDVSGPFVFLIINKETSEIQCITDMMSFIPVFIYRNSQNIMLGTHVDALARAAGQTDDMDSISIADFILHSVVTFPYTIYKSIHQSSPATHNIIQGNVVEKTIPYWIPEEEQRYSSMNVAANNIRNALTKYVNTITSEVSDIAQFISGGEDSRVLSALLKDNPRDAYVFLDQMNTEGRMAKKAAKKYGATFKMAQRDRLHYLHMLPDTAELVGGGSEYRHAHAFGFQESYGLHKYDAVFGGLFADALLKGARIQKTPLSIRYSFVPDIREKTSTKGNRNTNRQIKAEILSEISSRRKSHFNYVKSFRENSAEEWFELWPSSMNMNIPNIHANRRLMRSYEPFMDKEVVKISATVPQEWKLNRRLFQQAVKPFLKPTKWLFHSDGRLPYFPWYINSFVAFVTWVYFRLGYRIGFVKGNQGPWADWEAVVKSSDWEHAVGEYSSGFSKISPLFLEQDVEQLFQSNAFNLRQKVNLLQVLYQLANR